MRYPILCCCLVTLAFGAEAFAQLSDRPLVTRRRTEVRKTTYQSKTAAQRLIDQGHTGSPKIVWRMRTATGRLLHQMKVRPARMVGRHHVGLKLIRVSESSTWILVSRRTMAPKLIGERPVAVENLVAQFPTYTDFAL